MELVLQEKGQEQEEGLANLLVMLVDRVKEQVVAMEVVVVKDRVVVVRVGSKKVRRQIMPRGDRTGPNGMGSMTGRAAGFCTGNNVAGFQNQFGGRGLRNGYGAGYGRGNGSIGFHNFSQYSAYPTKEQELANLQASAGLMKKEMEGIEKRIQELESAE